MGDTCMGLLFILFFFRERLHCHPTLEQNLTDFYITLLTRDVPKATLPQRLAFSEEPASPGRLFLKPGQVNAPFALNTASPTLALGTLPHVLPVLPVVCFTTVVFHLLFAFCFCFWYLVNVYVSMLLRFSQRSLPGGSLQLEDLNSSFFAVLFRKTPSAVSH